MKIINILRLIGNFVLLSLNPKRTDNALGLVDRLYDLGLFRMSVAHLKSNPLTAEVFQNPRFIEPINLDEYLNKYPKGSLGHALAETMIANGFDPNYFRRYEPTTEEKIILTYLDQTHDIWHFVTGFDTDVPGEVGLQAFMLGQLRTPQSIIFIAGGLVRCLFKDQHLLAPTLEQIVRGWQLSKTYYPLFAVNWTEQLDRNLDDLKREFGGSALERSG